MAPKTSRETSERDKALRQLRKVRERLVALKEHKARLELQSSKAWSDVPLDETAKAAEDEHVAHRNAERERLAGEIAELERQIAKAVEKWKPGRPR